ncbi:sensor histidine kinase [Donghicola sp.]|jgi:two-component sensor histidine kinase|uniref:sensor histidine kinase n=1 Tax=Donghicola sp. TaxID=1929294 RepID=UPI0025E680BB|nr:sensor histidine kinase [Donghicola sp.]MCT4578735.1 sensor histidine kinase [Donghicola sp.]
MSEGKLEAMRSATGGLALRLIGVMTLAILPLALISFYQTAQVMEESDNLSETVLLDRTERAASRERELIQQAIGAAKALAETEIVMVEDANLCNGVLKSLVEGDNTYTMAGYITASGRVACASDTSDEILRIGRDLFSKIQQSDPNADFWSNTSAGPKAALSLAVPVGSSSARQGYVWISIPYALANIMLQSEGNKVDLVIFDATGALLAADFTEEELVSFLPQGRSLSDFVQPNRQLYNGPNQNGENRQFAVVPIMEDQAFVMGSWEPEQIAPFPLMGRVMALYFPLLMWGIGILVAYFGTHRLVIRHIQRLRVWMRLYAAGRSEVSSARLDNAPEELEAVAQAFREMAQRLSEQERQRAEDLTEKTTLLKEVHHRVKNNLQLICSIMNMQVRNASSDEAKRLLRRVQERVMALAAVHRYLYTARKLSMVRADLLLEDIISQMVVVGGIDRLDSRVKISTNFANVEITPEQSVPLSLLATEAITNAVKYCGGHQGQTGWISLVLADLGNDEVCFSIVNSKSDIDATQIRDEPSLGHGLIKSFASQLQGRFEVEDLDERYGIHVTFDIMYDDEEEESQAA